jgi:hypothetical protein
VRGTVDHRFKINEYLDPSGADPDIWPSLAQFDPNTPRKGVKTVVSYDVRKKWDNKKKIKF